MTTSSGDHDVGPLEPIGWVTSPITSRHGAPRQPDENAPSATLALKPGMEPAVAGIDPGDHIIVLTWLHQANRSTLTTRPRNDPDRAATGVFATRSPDRPNPIGVHRTTVTRVDGSDIEVSELEAIDGTPILDIKPALGPVVDR